MLIPRSWGAMALGLVLAGPAHGQTTCETLTPILKDRLSVAWISPLSASAGHRSWVPVVQTSELREVLGQTHADLARMLQLLGMRRRSSPPKRRFKVVVFEVDPEHLCRPIDGPEQGTIIDGQVACPPRFGKAKRHYKGCGFTTDRLDASRGLDLYRVQWRDVARSGFCVLPADRFVQGE